MIVIGKKTLRDFMERHADARSEIESWVADVEGATWMIPQDVRADYPKVTLPGDKQAVFNIRGNDYRLWVKIDYEKGTVLVKKVGTHKEYDKWDIK